jgi:alpha-N-arabinofuranosidase
MKTEKLKLSLVLFLYLLIQSILASPGLEPTSKIDTIKEYHVSKKGSNNNVGTKEFPLLTIQAAADRANPGDIITVHEGIYRERVNPPRGGISDNKRIVYQAATNEKVVITGSELVTGWKKVENDTWFVTLPNRFFGGFNPYKDVLDGHWFRPKDRIHHTGSVYLNGVWRGETAKLEDVLKPVVEDPLWFGEVKDSSTTIWAQFKDVDPNSQTVEINVRQTVFFPEKTGRNYITVRGFTLRQAATPWSAPTQKQMGLIGPYWSKGWIIENNIISHSITVGVSLGTTYLGEYPGNVHGNYGIMKDASTSGVWCKEKIGSHVVRGNKITNCEAAGINGNMGGAFSLIENNYIADIHTRRSFGGLEQGGIKLHGAINTIIRNNIVCRTGGEARAIWLDWLGQGAVICGNIAFDNDNTDLYVEVTHGPTLVVNNIFLSKRSVVSTSRGTAYLNNYFGGSVAISQTTRKTPYAKPHSTELLDLVVNNPGDDRYLNNIFAWPGKVFVPGWGGIDTAQLDSVPFDMEGNLYLNGANPPVFDKNPVVIPQASVPFILKNSENLLEYKLDPNFQKKIIRPAVTTLRLGKAQISGLPYEMPDGSSVLIDTDFFGHKRNRVNVIPGPIEKQYKGEIYLEFKQH